MLKYFYVIVLIRGVSADMHFFIVIYYVLIYKFAVSATSIILCNFINIVLKMASNIMAGKNSGGEGTA